MKYEEGFQGITPLAIDCRPVGPSNQNGMNINVHKTTNGQPHLSGEQLNSLLRIDDGSDQFGQAVNHLESCIECQRRLTALAAEDSWWKEAHTFLSGDDDGDSEPRWLPDVSISSMATGDLPQDAQAIDQMLREVLGTPRHPEMFGRLGRYDIERVIGHGGMGVVLKAHDSELNRPIAIKLLAGHLAHVGAARERFGREGRAAAAVVHEHVVAIHNVESNGRIPFLVMQYVPGRSLQARVDQDGPLGAEEILRIGMQAAAGLAAAHRQGLVHRDVKPSNILLEDTVERAVLTDFGLARTFDDASLTHTGILAGTPHYMSPEQATGESIDPRSDLFSLGAVLYFMATGHPPFRASGAMAVLHRICHDTHRPVWQRNAEIPDELSDLIDRLLEKKPSKRYSSADEVQRELATLLSRLQQHGLGRRRFRGFHVKRYWKHALAAAAALVAIAAVASALRTQLVDGKTKTIVSSAPEASSNVAPQAAGIVAIDPDLADNPAQWFEEMESAKSVLKSESPETHFMYSGEDPWQREFEALHRDITTLEREAFSDQ
jgi:serine/threonine protein kinase